MAPTMDVKYGGGRTESIMFEKANDNDNKKSIEVRNDDGNSLSCYICWETRHADDDRAYLTISYRTLGPIETVLACDWDWDSYHDEEKTRKTDTPPTCFMFKRGEWFPASEPIVYGNSDESSLDDTDDTSIDSDNSED
mmetsp:Transcript_8851/g.12547  ORF Transcript_8851/g.12547 Transcript_8851/m.12547 type:complete len:138 (+) Transcript_8851:1048-1461(+)